MCYSKSIAVRLSVILSILFVGLSYSAQAQDHPGSAGKSADRIQPSAVQMGLNAFHTATALQQDDSKFNTTVFTFTDIAIFSYANDTKITILNAAGDTVKTKMLQDNEFELSSPGTGIYRIFGSKSFTALIGDATSNIVQGYYAVDQSGRGTSTLFNTYMMGRYDGGERFIVSAYENNTEFTIKNLETGELMQAGVLDAGEHYTMPNTPYDTFLQVNASKPVSALSYGDQDYYVPAANGTFSGQEFLGYSAYIGNWTNSITVTGYHDNTEVSIINTVTEDTINTYTINEGEVRTEPITEETYWKVESNKTVTAANIPYAGWSGNYYYMTRAIDEKGVGSGKLFYMPTIQSQINVFSYADANNVKIQRLGQHTDYPYPDTTTVFDGQLDAGEGYTFDSQSGQYVYKIQGSENISVIQSNGGAGAEFMPLSFAQDLPDLAVSSEDIQFDPDKNDYSEGEKIDVTVKVNNYGPIEASNIPVKVYQGDPDGEGTAPLLYEDIIPMLDGESSKTISFEYTVPSNPEFRRLVVKVDPDDRIKESNDSNNKAGQSIEPNKDLLPPVAVTVDLTGSLRLNEDGELEPNPFTVEATFLNTGDVDAEDVKIEFVTFDGLSLYEGDQEQTMQTMPPGEKVTMSWKLQANLENFGANRIRIRVTGSNLEGKNVNRAVYVPLVPPQGLTFANTSEATSVKLSWDQHMSDNISGYKIYRGPNPDSMAVIDSVGPNMTSFTDAELALGTYFYAITAYGAEYIESSLVTTQAYHVGSAGEEWRLVSLPTTETEVALNNSQIFRFDGTYESSSKLATGLGYWIKSREGEYYSSYGGRLLSNSVEVHSGWNLVGALGARFDPSMIEDPDGVLTETPIYTYEEGSYTEPEMIAPGQGIWVYASEDGTLNMSAGATSASNKNQRSPHNRRVDKLDRIVFEAGEATQEFFMSNDQLNSSEEVRYLLPPKAPDPQLDVRTSRGYRASGQKMVTLDLSAETYPVKVSLPNEKRVASSSYRLIVYDENSEQYLDLVPGKTVTISENHDKVVLKRLHKNEVPVENKLSPNYPNPFNPSTTIKYQVGSQAKVTMNVYNVLGQQVRTLVNEAKQPGTYKVRFDASDLASGVYYVRIQIGDFSELQKMTLIK